MLRILLLLACAAGLLAQSVEETAVREVVRKYVDAREHQDPKAVEALFTADADQLTTAGEWRRGRDEVVNGSMASSQRTGGTRTIEIEVVRFPTTDVAIADGRYEIAGPTETRKMRTTFVMARTRQGWKITAIRNMLPAPPAAGPRPERPSC